MLLFRLICRTTNSKHRRITEKVDVWELGILMYYLAFYSTPFESVDGKIDTAALAEGRFSFPTNDDRKYSKEFLDMISSMLTVDVSKWVIAGAIMLRRPSIEKVIVNACSMTRWRMTDEVKEILDIVQQRDRKKPAKKKVVAAKKSTAKSKGPAREKSASHMSSLQPATASLSSRSTSTRSQAPLQLSDSDVSSSSDAEELVQQKREAGEITDRIRTSMLQYFGGKKNHTRWVMKCTSRVPEPPPHRSIKKIAIAAYENKSMDFFFALLAKWGCKYGVRRRRPLFTSEIVAVKALTTTLCIFQMSTQEVAYQSFKHVSLLKEISTKWKIVEVGIGAGREA